MVTRAYHVWHHISYDSKAVEKNTHYIKLKLYLTQQVI